jgi:hypothetical protein
MNRWFRYRRLRFLVFLKKKFISIMRRLETKDLSEMDQIQKVIFQITSKLIHDPNTELRSNNIDYTYHIENENYLVIIRPQSGHYSINLIEYKTRQLINNFDVLFDVSHVKILIEQYEREVHKRMKSKLLMKTTKVVKHLQSILTEIDERKRIS